MNNKSVRIANIHENNHNIQHFPDIYWISSKRASGLPAVEVNGNAVSRATFGNIALGGRERYGKFVTSFDGQQYIADSFDVS